LIAEVKNKSDGIGQDSTANYSENLKPKPISQATPLKNIDRHISTQSSHA
jgi:hypothetical protein